MRSVLLVFGVVMSLFVNAQTGSSISDQLPRLRKSQLDSAFAKANTAYTQTRYDEAIATYQMILESGQHSEELYFNLANAYFKANQNGEAAYHYYKALDLNQDMEAATNNLAMLQKRLEDEPGLSVDSTEPSPWDAFVGSLTSNEWGYLGVVALVLAALFFILYYYTIPVTRKRVFFGLFVFLLIFGILMFQFSYLRAEQVEAPATTAVVMVEKATMRSEPSTQSDSIITIHEGTRIELLDRYSNWREVRTGTGAAGWLPEVVLKTL